MKKINGLTLIELMMALSLTTLVFVCITATTIAMIKNYKLQISMDDVSTRALTAINFFKNNLQSGGCLQEHRVKIEGADHWLTVHRIRLSHANLIKSDGSHLYVSQDVSFDSHDNLVIYNCEQLENLSTLNVLQRNTYQLINLKDNLKKTYLDFAQIAQSQTKFFYVKNTGRFTAQHQPLYALYEMNQHGHKTELVEGIREINFLYFVIDNNQTVLRNAAEIGDWQTVQGVQVNMTIEANDDQTKSWLANVILS